MTIHMTIHITTRYAAVLAALALTLSACSGVAPDPTLPGTDTVSPAPTDSTGAPGDGPETPVEVPELQFTTTTVADGSNFDASTLAGQDVIFWFWAPWCPICQAESSHVAAAALELPDGVTLIGVAGHADVPAMQRFLSDYGVGEFEHVVDADGSIWASFGVPSQPAYAFINDDGDIRTVLGAIGKSGLLEAAEDLASR